MSSVAGHSSKGEKGKGKYTAININNLYKGKTTETQKTTITRQYGLQSLGKVGSVRRMPPPANLPSLKSESSGNDPNINLVPTGGSGWGAKEKEKESSCTQSSPSQATVPTTQSAQSTVKTSTPGGTNVGVKSWSSVTVSGNVQGVVVSHQSPMFKEEFPTLAGDEKDGKIPKEGGTGEEKDVQYGPGPSLRPQNVGSWREGGGRGTSQQPQKGELTTSPSQPTANQTETQANGPQTPISVSNQSPVPPMPGRPGSTQGPPQGPLPMGPMGMPPPQYRGMMPPYMFGRNFPGPGFPPNYPGMPRPFPYDGRFQRGPPPVQNRPNNNNLVDEDGQQAMSFHRAAIITDKDLKNFDQILKAEPSDGGWAGAQGEIDYSAKLVFSDEEDEGSEKNRERRKRQQHHRQYDKRTDRDEHDGDYSDQHGERDRGDPRDRVDGRRQSPQDKDINQDKDNQGRDNVPRENWQGQMPPQFRGGQQRHPHPGMDARGWPMHPYDYPMRPPFPFRMAHPGQQRTNFGHPVAGPAPPPSQQASSPNKKSCEDDDELWQQRRKQSSDEVSAIVQRARQRREESEKKSEAERKAAAAEKLKQLDERSKKREEVKSEDEDKKSEGCISRTSESSEKDPRERIPSRDGSKHPQSNQGYNKSRNTVPPRFQKQQQEQMRQSVTTSQSPGTAGTHTGMPPQGFRQGPPPHWPYDMRAWASIPPFMDPRYGGRPPVDIQGMPMFPPQVRRRTDSHGSGADSQDDNRPSDSNFEQQQRDHRNWLESRGYPPPPSHPGAYDEMRRAQNFYMFQQEYERYEMERNSRDYDRQNTGEDDHESGASDHESINKDEEDHNCEGPREVFDDVNNDRTDKDDKTKEIPKDKSKEKDFEKKRDDSDDKEDDRWGSYRSARHASSPGSLRSYNSDERPSKNDFRRDNYPYCPPPMPQPQQPPPSRSNNYTSLKRSASNMSSSSNTSQDRKSDSPKDIPTTEKLNLHKEPNKELLKELKTPNKDIKLNETRSDYDKGKRNEIDNKKSNEWENKHRDQPPKSKWDNRPPNKSEWLNKPKKPEWDNKSYNKNDREFRSPKPEHEHKPSKNEWESKPCKLDWEQSKNDKYDWDTKPKNDWESKPKNEPENKQPNYWEKSKEKQEEQKRKEALEREKENVKEGNEDNKPSEKKMESTNQSGRPPVKRKKDEDYGRYSDKSDRYRDDDRNRMAGRGREFVRGRGRGRARGSRGSYSTRGRGRSDYRGYDRPYHSNSSRQDNGGRGTIGRWGDQEEENEENYDASKRRRGKDEDSDVSVDDTSGSFSETSSERTSEARDNSRPKENSASNRDSKNTKPKEDSSSQSKNRDKDRNSSRSNYSNNRERSSGDKRDSRNYGDSDRQGSQRNQDYQDGTKNYNAFVPRGEPSRRGRGGSASGSVPRGGPRGKRFNSGPPRAGFSRPQGNSGSDRRDYQTEGPSREYRRTERNQPPRFARRGGFQDRGRGFDRGRGRGRGRGSNSAPSRPPLTKQTSNEGEEWETASESSDFNRDSKNDKDGGKDRREPQMSKKSFSNQRPLNDRQNRRVPSDTRNIGGMDNRNSNKEKSPNSTKNGTGPPRNGSGGPKNKASIHINHKENVNVYRVDGIVHSDPTAINNAINSMANKKRKPDLTDVSKPLPNEKEKKDALANIDINNYASVVVIDDQPEVTIDDPTFLYEKDDGFQEVTYKKAVAKKKVQEAEQRKSTELKKTTKVVAKPKGMSSKSDRQRFSKANRLPPRLAKKKEEEEKEKEMSKNIMPKIEQWDNDLANDIPSSLNGLDVEENKSTGTTNMSQVMVKSSTTVTGPTALAPVPTVSAWTKPINFAVNNTGHELKFEKGDNHDSGIDVSDQPNSAASSTRSSPSAENKLKDDQKVEKLVVDTFKPDMEIGEYEAPKPQRQPKSTRIMKTSKESTGIEESEKKPDVIDQLHRTTTIEKSEPIQMPATYKDSLFGKGDNSMKLDFEFDASLVDITEERSESLEMTSTEMTKPIVSSNDPITSQPVITTPTSPSTQDLNQKIALVKKVWDCGTVYKRETIHETSQLTPRKTISSHMEDNLSNNNSFTAFSTSEVERSLTPVSNVMDNVISSRNDLNGFRSDNSYSPGQSTLSPRHSDYLNFSTAQMDMKMSDVETKSTFMSEASNVCKVKPQQFQHLDFIMSNTSNLMSNMSAVPSPPVVVQNQPFQTIQLGTQLLAPESRFTQQNFGFSLSQTQPPTQLGQSSFSQQSMFVPTPNQQDLYQPSQLAPYQRNQAFNQSPQQNYGQTQQNYSQNPTHNTIMVSSTSSLMSTSIKPPSTNTYGSLQKNLTSGSVQFNQGLNNSSVQPSQMFIQYEPSLFNSSQLLASNPTNSQNVNPSQLMSSHIVQPRNAVQTVQSVQPSTYFPQSQPTLPQTGYYPSQAQPTSALQGALQQVAATAPQFSLHAFGNQGQGLGLTLQQSASNTNLMNSSQHMSLSNTAGNQPTANKQSSQFNSIIQQQSPQNNAMKSPSQNMTPNSMITPNSMMNTALSALSPNSKVFTSQVQNRQPPRFPNVAQLQGNKYGNTFVAQQLSGAASVVRPSIMVGSMMRSNAAPPTQPTFPPPIQRPGVQQNTTLITQTTIPTPVIVTQSTNPSMKALHEKQRREVLAHAQSFLNPQNKPSIKSPPKADSLEDKNLSDAISSITENKSDNQLATTKDKN